MFSRFEIHPVTRLCRKARPPVSLLTPGPGPCYRGRRTAVRRRAGAKLRDFCCDCASQLPGW